MRPLRVEVAGFTTFRDLVEIDLADAGYFAFVGPTTAYALMQATGMVDDHLAGCFVAVA